ncbi:hypothetical protein [Bifidobacterium sp. SO1]|uniref:hypothetical protein n=1 Tax=Bifidobacterium sp. SO1 TaxID=2809029 RepID=UPI001BDC7101|nr:hypothetical protein [Bifidobacterium sp. SO1]MBT1162962.1 hypothetical protein [Bifidobacterium sp. SO1]
MSDNENTNVPTHEDPDMEPTVAMTAIPDGMPESIQAEADPAEFETTDDKPVKKPRPKWLIPAIAAGCAIILIVGGVVVWRTMDAKHRLASAKAACENGLTTVNSAKTAWEKKLQDQTVIDALKITEDKVADAKTVTKLKTLTGTKYGNILDCTATDVAGYGKITSSNQQLQSKYEDNASALAKTVSAVNDSMALKTLNDAKDSLKKTVDSAKKLLTDSKDKVADEKTRDTLSKAIDTAAKSANTVDEVTKLNKTLSDAINQVNASIQAKKDADAKAQAEAESAAQAQAEADAAAAAAQAQTQQSYSGYDYTYQNTTPQTTTPQTTVPQQQTQPVTPQAITPQQNTAPQQSANSNNENNSNGSSGFDWTKYKDSLGCPAQKLEGNSFTADTHCN